LADFGFANFLEDD